MRLSAKAIALLSAADRDSKILAVARANGKVTMAMKTAQNVQKKHLWNISRNSKFLLRRKLMLDSTLRFMIYTIGTVIINLIVG